MTNPIDPARLENAIDCYMKANGFNADIIIRAILESDDRYRREHPPKLSSEQWKRYGELIEQDRLGDAFLFLRDILLAPAPHDAAKETNMSEDARITELATQLKTHHSGSYYTIEHWSYVARTAIEWLAANPSPQTDASKEVSPTGITPSANPTSWGKVEQDAAGEEREPELNGTRFNGDHYILSNGDEISEYTPASLLREIADHAEWRARQHLQDKREKETAVTVKAINAFASVYGSGRRYAYTTEEFIRIRDALAAAMKEMKETT